MKKEKHNKAVENAEEPIVNEEAENAEAEAPEATIEQWQAALETAVDERDKALKKVGELQDAYLRAQADFQNFKRRNATSRADGFTDGVCEVLTQLLPALDNMERALAAADANDPLAKGVEMTLKQIFDGMQKFGLEEIEAQGLPFDPEKHNAVMREEGGEPGMVLEVLQKGYRAKDKILRYAMVKVSM